MNAITAPQERIEQNVRMVLGDMHVQLIVAQARIAELEAELAAIGLDKSEPPTKTNGKTTRLEAS